MAGTRPLGHFLERRFQTIVNVEGRINRRSREYMNFIRDTPIINKPKVLAFNIFTFLQFYF